MNRILDPKNEKARKKFKIIGPIILGIGITLFIISIISFFVAFNSMEFPNLIWLPFIAIPLIGIGSFMTKLGYMKQMSSYVASQTAPIAKDTINYLVDGTSDTIANAINNVKNNQITCPNCKTLNDVDASYCDNCGKPLKNVCPKCHSLNDPDASYCKKCGSKL